VRQPRNVLTRQRLGLGQFSASLASTIQSRPGTGALENESKSGLGIDLWPHFGVESAAFSTMADQVRVSGKQVLLVEDDQGARESIKLLLTIDRHRVTEARNGQHAMELFHEYFFDLVIIDYFMPQMHGKELAGNLKAITATVPILMVTAYAEKLVDMDIQVDSILPKPFGVAELRHAIAKLLKT